MGEFLHRRSWVAVAPIDCGHHDCFTPATVNAAMKTLLLATLFATHAYALELEPGEHTLTGKVSSVQPDSTFILATGGDRVLVYARTEQVSKLHVGSTVEVRGTVPKDWIKLARLELQAAKVLVLVP